MTAIDVRKKLRRGFIFEDLSKVLDPYKERKAGSVKFLVDSSPDGKIRIFIKYPGRKVFKRKLKQNRLDSIHWDFLYDFLVVPEFGSKMLNEKDFTYRKILTDFDENKKHDNDFWSAILEVLEKNNVAPNCFSNLKGIDSRLFLYVLKWLWIQEDLNYRFNHKDFSAPTRYRLPRGKSLGRKKFFASLILVRTPYYTAKECSKLFS